MGIIKSNLQEPNEQDPNETDAQEQAETPDEQADEAGTEGQDPNEAGEGEDGGPEYEKFIAAAKVVLYQDGGLADKIAEQLRASKTPVDTLADQVYNLVAALDERSKGMLPDELLAPAAADILGMVVEIASHAGVKLSHNDVGHAMTEMVQRYMREAGQEQSQGGPEEQAEAPAPQGPPPPQGMIAAQQQPGA